ARRLPREQPRRGRRAQQRLVPARLHLPLSGAPRYRRPVTRTPSPSLPSRRSLLRLAGGGLALGTAATVSSAAWARSGPANEVVLAEAVSRYNRIRVAERGTVRTMYFVGDDGTQYIESRHDRSRPRSLDLDYTRTMMAGFLLQPRPRRLL